jgi:hypothetical protein
VTLLRPISVAVLLALTPAPLVAADASPQSPSNRPPQTGEGQLIYLPPPPLPISPPQAGEGKVGAGEGREGGAAPPSPLAAQPLDRLSATRERPLFSPTRRPPPPPPPVVVAPEPPPPPPPPPDVALFGIVMDGDEARAVVRAGPAAKIMQVRVGDDIGGWKVAQIDGRRLILSLDDRIATFLMFAGNSAKGAPPLDRETQSTDRQPQTQTQTQPQNQMPQNAPPPPDPPPSGARKPHRSRG